LVGVLKALRAQVVAHASTLGVEKAVPPLSRRGQGLPVANAKLPEDLFLAHAVTENGLVSRNKDLADPIGGPQADAKPCPARIRLDIHLGLIAHGLEQALQTGNRPDGCPHPIGLARLDKGRMQRGDGCHQTLDPAGRVGRALHRHSDDACNRGCSPGIR